MGTSAGFEFKATDDNAKRLENIIPALDDVTNACGLAVACTPIFNKSKDGSFYFSAQTHWSYDGENGRAFLAEAKKMIKEEGIEIDIFDEWVA